MAYSLFKIRWLEINKTDNRDVEWITVNGAHIPIKNGQGKEDAIMQHGNNSSSNTIPKPIKVYRGEGGQMSGRAAIYGSGTYFAEGKEVAGKYGDVKEHSIDPSKYFDGTKELPKDILNRYVREYARRNKISASKVKSHVDIATDFVSSPDYYSVISNMPSPKNDLTYEENEKNAADILNNILKEDGYEGVRGYELSNDKYTDNVIYNKFPIK